MDSIILNFANDLNASIRVGDIALYKDSGTGDIITMGAITSIGAQTFTCNIPTDTVRPTTADFVFFAKDNIVNTSGLIGYYAEVKMAITPAADEELFAVSTEIFVSS